MMVPRIVLFLAVGSLAFSGCMASDPASVGTEDDEESIPSLAYRPPEPDMALQLVETSTLIDGAGVDVYVRIVRPEGEGPFPVVSQFTPYTAPGRNAEIMALAEPALGPDSTTFVNEFVRRGYAFAFADVRGTGDSSGCLDLRGQNDIDDLWHLTEYLGTQSWSNGKVGFIGASYPGSEAHMAALAGNEHLGAVIPIVASTSFYHYHHNDGVPYDGNHALGGTNTGYTQNAIAPTVNPQQSNYADRYAEETRCPYTDNMVTHGGMDQSGSYYAWWQERNLRPQASTVAVPVLMAQGLADWNVKPDHIATWYNGLSVQKTLIAGQWGHAYPQDTDEAYGDWWEYATAFFDTHLKGIETGMFDSDVAWVEDNDGTWHRSTAWPLLSDERGEVRMHFTSGGLSAESADEATELSWLGCPNDRVNRGTALEVVEDLMVECDESSQNQELVFLTPPFEEDTRLSGVPLVNLTLRSEASTHLVVVVARLGANGEVLQVRENYGYLNPVYRSGLEDPQTVPVDEPYAVTIDLYPQEDVVKAGERLRVTIRSDDEGRTIEFFEEGENTLLLGPGNENTITFPTRPADLQGVRLGEAEKA